MAHALVALSALHLQEAGDPLLNTTNAAGATGPAHFTVSVIAVLLIKVLVAFVVLLVCTAMMIWYERKFIADMQNRIGPNRAGPFGLFQTLADGTKLFFKEALFPKNAERTVFRLAPYISALPAFLTICVIPLGGKVNILGHDTLLQVASPPMGVLFSLGVSSIAVYGVMLAGWSSGSKYPLMGSVRASAQMISYEAAMGLSLASVVLLTGSLSPQAIVAGQAGGLFHWNIVRTIALPAIVFAIAGTAELNRPPFDLVEAESELVGGFHTEYSSARFAMFYLAEFMNTITMSALIVTLFLGGPNFPVDWDVPFFGAVSPLWLALKVFVMLSIYIALRATLPRYRYDQLMDLGWKKLIPASLIWLLILAAREASTDRADKIRNVLIAFAVSAIAAGLLWAAMRVGKRTADSEFDASAAAAVTAGGRPGRF